MRYGMALALIGLPACAAVLASEAMEDRREISANNPWSITMSTCAIDEAWDDGAGVMVSLHEDHYDLGIYDPGYKGVVQDKTIGVKIGPGGIAAASPYQANGVMGYKAPGYVAAVQPDLLDRIAKTQVLQVYRGGMLISDFNVEGFREALQRMRACEASMAAADAMSNATDAAMNAMDVMEPATADSEAASAAAEAAADAAAGVSPK